MSLLELTYRKPFKWPYVYNYASPIFLHVEWSILLQQQKKIGKNLQLEKGEIFDSGWQVESGWTHQPNVWWQVGAGWTLWDANRGGSGWPLGSQRRDRGGSGWSGSYGRTKLHILSQYCQLGFSSEIKVPQLGLAWNPHSSTRLELKNSGSGSSLLDTYSFYLLNWKEN